MNKQKNASLIKPNKVFSFLNTLIHTQVFRGEFLRSVLAGDAVTGRQMHKKSICNQLIVNLLYTDHLANNPLLHNQVQQWDLNMTMSPSDVVISLGFHFMLDLSPFIRTE